MAAPAAALGARGRAGCGGRSGRRLACISVSRAVELRARLHLRAGGCAPWLPRSASRTARRAGEVESSGTDNARQPVLRAARRRAAARPTASRGLRASTATQRAQQLLATAPAARTAACMQRDAGMRCWHAMLATAPAAKLAKCKHTGLILSAHAVSTAAVQPAARSASRALPHHQQEVVGRHFQHVQLLQADARRVRKHGCGVAVAPRGVRGAQRGIKRRIAVRGRGAVD
jgi:hypothetical protein